MQEWERIRSLRTDLTDYVVHFTKWRWIHKGHSIEGRPPMAKPIEVLLEILHDGCIRPTFAAMPNRYNKTPQPTIYGPDPAVCLTEQTLASIVECSVTTSRYSGYGIAYHKVALHELGGRPVIYGSEDMLGRKLRAGEEGFEDGKKIYQEGLPLLCQHLFALYRPIVATSYDYPIDFTWEKEWRIKPPKGTLPVALEHSMLAQKGISTGAIIVQKDEDADVVRKKLYELEVAGKKWINLVGRIISLEEAKRRLETGDKQCARIETWPE